MNFVSSPQGVQWRQKPFTASASFFYTRRCTRPFFFQMNAHIDVLKWDYPLEEGRGALQWCSQRWWEEEDGGGRRRIVRGFYFNSLQSASVVATSSNQINLIRTTRHHQKPCKNHQWNDVGYIWDILQFGTVADTCRCTAAQVIGRRTIHNALQQLITSTRTAIYFKPQIIRILISGLKQIHEATIFIIWFNI